MPGSRGTGPNGCCCGSCPNAIALITGFSDGFAGWKANSDGTFSPHSTFGTGFAFQLHNSGGEFRGDDLFIVTRDVVRPGGWVNYGTFQAYARSSMCSTAAPSYLLAPTSPSVETTIDPTGESGRFTQGPAGYIHNVSTDPSSVKTSNFFSVNSSGSTLVAQFASSDGTILCVSRDDLCFVSPPGDLPDDGSGQYSGGSLAWTFDGTAFTVSTNDAVPLPADHLGTRRDVYSIMKTVPVMTGFSDPTFAWGGSTLGFWLTPSGSGGGAGANGFITATRTGNTLTGFALFPLQVGSDTITNNSIAAAGEPFAISPDGSLIAFSAYSIDGTPLTSEPQSGVGSRVHLYKNGVLTANVVATGENVRDEAIWQISISDDGKALAAAFFGHDLDSGTVIGRTCIWKINADGTLTELDQVGGASTCAAFSHRYRCPV